jgi:hypothetical protein
MKISPTGYWIDPEHYGVSPCLAAWLGQFFSEVGKPHIIHDFGCGNGYYLSRLAQSTCQEYELIGYEGEPLPPEKLLFPNVRRQDLTRKFDVERPGHVLCLEVGEHIPAGDEDMFLSNITQALWGALVLSWAVPGQAGDGHVNCRSNEYIIDKLRNWGFDYFAERTKEVRAIYHGECPWFADTLMVFYR